MDWFSWLSKTNLEPSLVYEYGLTLAHNELEEEDIAFFNHEFLQSMGISIAKHRLEILKLARKEKGKRPRSVSRLIVAIKRTKRCLANYMRSLIRCEEESSALVVVPTTIRRPSSSGYGTRWKSSVMKRNNKKFKVANNNNNKQERLLLTNGSTSCSAIVPALPGLDGFTSPMVCKFQKDDDDDNGYWSSALKEIRSRQLFKQQTNSLSSFIGLRRASLK